MVDSVRESRLVLRGTDAERVVLSTQNLDPLTLFITVEGSKFEWDGDSWNQTYTVGSAHSYASASLLELVDISSTDHTVLINGGQAMAIYCNTAGEILKIDTGRQTAFTTLALQAGWNQIAVTKVYKTGSTIAGSVMLGAW